MIEDVAASVPRTRLATRRGGPASVRPTRDRQVFERTRDILLTGKQLIREEVWPSANAISRRTSHSVSVIEREVPHLNRLRRLYVRKWKTHPKQWTDPATVAATVDAPPAEATVPASALARVQAQLDHALDVLEQLKASSAKSGAAKDARIAALEQENAWLLQEKRSPRMRTLLEDRAAEHDAHRAEDAIPVLPKKDTRRRRS